MHRAPRIPSLAGALELVPDAATGMAKELPPVSRRGAMLDALRTLVVAVAAAPLLAIAASDYYGGTFHGRAYPLLVILVPFLGGFIVRGWPLVILPAEAMAAWYWAGERWISGGHEIAADTTLLGLPQVALLRVAVEWIGFMVLFIAVVGWLMARVLAPQQTRRATLVRLGLFVAALPLPIAMMLGYYGPGREPLGTVVTLFGTPAVVVAIAIISRALRRWEFVPIIAFLVWVVGQAVAGLAGEGLNDELPMFVVIPIMLLSAFCIFAVPLWKFFITSPTTMTRGTRGTGRSERSAPPS